MYSFIHSFKHSLLNNSLTSVYYISELGYSGEQNRYNFQVSQSLQLNDRASPKTLTAVLCTTPMNGCFSHGLYHGWCLLEAGKVRALVSADHQKNKNKWHPFDSVIPQILLSIYYVLVSRLGIPRWMKETKFHKVHHLMGCLGQLKSKS